MDDDRQHQDRLLAGLAYLLMTAEDAREGDDASFARHSEAAFDAVEPIVVACVDLTRSGLSVDFGNGPRRVIVHIA